MKHKPATIQSPQKTNELGVSIVIVAISLFLFLGVAALAIDISHLYLVRNELQNAADAGALAGARVLFDEDVNINASEAYAKAEEAAEFNKALAEGGPLTAEVEVDQNIGDVQIGHWSFGLGETERGFTAPEGALPTKPVPDELLVEYEGQLSQIPTEKLDAHEGFINAVQVTARRNAYPVASFFARIFRYPNFKLSATATAYLGFAGSIFPGELDQPIAMCEGAVNEGCKSGRMINGGEDSDTSAWVNFVQPCDGGAAPASDVKDLVCADGNTNALSFGVGMKANPGVMTTAASILASSGCWGPWKNANQSWPMALPVIECPTSNCVKLIGAVNIHLLWINDATDPKWTDIPVTMAITNPKSLAEDYDDPTDIKENYDAYEDGPLLSNEWTCKAYEDFIADPPVDNQGEEVSFDNATNKDAINARKKCWNEFVKYYNLQTGSGKYPYIEADYVDDPTDDKDNYDDKYGSMPEDYHTYEEDDLYDDIDLQKTLFFLPDCDYFNPTGDTGGQNFGVLAKIPKLVQ